MNGLVQIWEREYEMEKEQFAQKRLHLSNVNWLVGAEKIGKREFWSFTWKIQNIFFLGFNPF